MLTQLKRLRLELTILAALVAVQAVGGLRFSELNIEFLFYKLMLLPIPVVLFQLGRKWLFGYADIRELLETRPNDRTAAAMILFLAAFLFALIVGFMTGA